MPLKSLQRREHDLLVAMLIEARQKAKVSQRQLAKKLGRTQSYVSKYEMGDQRIDVVEFIDIARALLIEPAVLILKLDHETREM